MASRLIVIGNHGYATCQDCGKFVRVTGLFGSWHLCLSPEELAYQQRERQAQMRQRAATAEAGRPFLGLLS